MTRVISSLSKEYVGINIGASANPTADVVKMAFMADGEKPDTADWKDAQWDTTPTPALPTGRYRARCLVAGEDAPNQTGAQIVLVVGAYKVWTKVTDNPEIPALECGTLKVE